MPKKAENYSSQREEHVQKPWRHEIMYNGVPVLGKTQPISYCVTDILKSRDITLPTKVSLVKAMVFPVVMYGCESWTVNKIECRRIDAFELWC